MSVIADRFSRIIRRFNNNLITIADRQQVLRTDIRFIDDTRLVAFEYTYFDTGRTKYSYQWMNAANELIHRWDNAHEVDLPTSPHHQHISSENNVLPSEPMTLETVLTLIADRLSA